MSNDVEVNSEKTINITEQNYTQEEVQEEILNQVKELGKFLINKNRKYGNAAIEPVRIFSRASNEEQIMVRLDDKLSRLINRQDDEDEDVILDILGYLILLRVLKSLKKKNK